MKQSGKQAVTEAMALGGKDEVLRRVAGAIYYAAVYWTEGIEAAGLTRGNGHHDAQDIAEEAKKLVDLGWKR